MCGIAGSYSNRKNQSDVVKNMVAQMPYRGPDAEGFYNKPPFFGGMCRLSINGLQNGDQPLFNNDQSIALLYNGEIYNYPSLKKSLESKGYSFKTGSDGEAICFLYQEFGDDFIDHLDGMYSISLWDVQNEKLILARDIQGEKPLYFLEQDGEFFYSSSIESFTHDKYFDLTLNKQAIWDFPTFLWIPQPETIYNEIKSVLPGEVITITATGLKSYRRNIDEFNTEPLKDSDAIELIRTELTSAVERQLMSDVPIGCFLSGGLDSSIVTTIAAKKAKELHTFTIGFEDLSDPYHGKADESAYALAYSKELGTKHTTIRVTGKTFYDQLKYFSKTSGQPFAVSSGLGIMSIAKEASSQGVKVLLSGDGADELFGGYSWYQNFPFDPNQRGNAEDFEFSMQRLDAKEKNILENIHNLNPSHQAWAWHYYASEKDKESLFTLDLKNETKSSLRHFQEVNDHWKGSQSFIENDRRLYLVNEMLQKADMMTMAHSVEGRLPFVSLGVQKAARRLSPNQLVRDGILKWALKEAFLDILPSDILTRPKHGFNVPIDHWLKSDWSDLVKHTFSSESQLSKHNLIQKNAYSVVEQMLNHPQRFNGHAILCYIMLNTWLEDSHSGRL